MGKSLKNIWTYIIIVFILGLSIFTIQNFARHMLTKDLNGEIELSEGAREYAAGVLGINTSVYKATKEELEDPIVYKFNSSAGNPKDYSMEFLFAQEKSKNPLGVAKKIYQYPSYIMFDVFALPDNQSLRHYSDALVWLFALGILIATIFFLRGNDPQ